MRAKRPARDLTVGALFSMALIILALAVMVVGGDSGLWFNQTRYLAVFPDATGLLMGAPVRMAGVQVGTVTGIRLHTDPGQPGILVDLDVDPAYAERLRADSRAALRILQFLTNEKYVEILPGSADQPVLEPGSMIPLLAEMGVVERGQAIADDLGEITVSLKKILGPLERGEGVIGKLLQDPEFGRIGIEALSATLVNLDRLTGELVGGRGTLGRLIHDPQLAGRLDRLAEVIDDVATVAAALSAREGALGDLLTEGGNAEQTLADLRDAAASFKQLASRLGSGGGLLDRLVDDPQYGADLARDLETTLASLAEITAKINAGEGTLGALVNERVLYDSAEDVVAGVDDSKFARWLIRHYRKKGIVAQEKAQEKEERERSQEQSEPPPDP